jgi:hypothetical protein
LRCDALRAAVLPTVHVHIQSARRISRGANIVTHIDSTSRPLEKYLILAVRYFFGGHALISGANHYLIIIPDIMPNHPEIAVRFMHVLIDSHLYDVVKVIEILTGLSLITGWYMPVTLMMEMPVTVIICYLSLFIAPTPRSMFSGIREVILNMFLLSSYWGYLRPLIGQPKPSLRPLWRETPSVRPDKERT